MCTLSNILDLLKEKNRSQKSLTDFLGISNSTFTDWKSGRNKSYNKYLPQIAEFFDVSVDYLLGKTDQKTPVSPFDDGQMQECIVLYRGGKPQVFHFSQKQLDIFASLLEQFNDNNL